MGTENNIREKLASFPRFELTFLPTPIERAKRFEGALGDRSPKIWIKRDDMTGLAYGGNKSRKLEYLVGDALAKGATVLISEGAAQSNHARQTAAAAALSGMRCVLVLDTRRGAEMTGNLLLDRLFGADVHLVERSEERKSTMAGIAADLEAKGERPYLIPTGGSVGIGALGYVNCVAELQAQFDEKGLRPSHLYFPTGSQGTLAGLVAGAHLFDVSFLVRGVAVEATAEHLAKDAVPIANETFALLGSDRVIDVSGFSIDDSQVGEGYAIPTAAGMEAISLLARTEAIVLDPVYTGKALAALVADVRAGKFTPEEEIVFLHTGGGPSVFANLAAYASVLD